MTSLKTKNIWLLAAFLFLSIVPTLAEVVDAVSDCKDEEGNEFLLQGTPPNIPGIILANREIQDQNRYKVICQAYGNKRWFLTLYDIDNKIPVFSAYEYSGKRRGGRPTKDWKIEPQLENKADLNKEMMEEGGGQTYNKQAVDADYTKEYTRGHLFPVSHAVSDKEKNSTFTLTNAVPQIKSFNEKSWSFTEQCIQYIMDYYINKRQMKCFVVVGAKPSENPPATMQPESTVNVPSLMWSAFYCSNTDSSIAAAHWGNNVEITSKTLLVMRTVEDLRNSDWARGIEVFPNTSPNAFNIGDIEKNKENNKVIQNVGNNCRFQ